MRNARRISMALWFLAGAASAGVCCLTLAGRSHETERPLPVEPIAPAAAAVAVGFQKSPGGQETILSFFSIFFKNLLACLLACTMWRIWWQRR